jgi:RHS repeat-associated protein
VVGSITGLASETATVNYANDQNYNLTIGGTITAGDIISLTVDNPSLAGGQTTVSYTTISTDTPTSVATGLTHAVNVSTALNTLGVGATSSAAILSLHSDPYYTTSTNGGATETLSVGTNRRGNAPITVGGTATTGDVLTITTNYASLSGGTHAVSYTVLSTDTPLSIANGLTAALAADTTLQSVGVTAAANSAFLSTSETFSGNALLPSGSSLASVTATDGSGNVRTATHQLTVTGPAATSLSYDANGNLTNDGTNTYLWDAENRLLQINYPGSGNNSQFTYDAYGYVVEIVETVSGTVTSTKQFVRTSGSMREARNSGGTVMAQYFSRGQTSSGANYFYGLTHRGDVVAVSNTSGTEVASITYDPSGRPATLLSTFTPDFGFAGLYVHQASGLNLAMRRAYKPNLGRWLNRDPLEEQGGINLYEYSINSPVNWVDPAGTLMMPAPPSAGPIGFPGLPPSPPPTGTPIAPPQGPPTGTPPAPPGPGPIGYPPLPPSPGPIGYPLLPPHKGKFPPGVCASKPKPPDLPPDDQGAKPGTGPPIGQPGSREPGDPGGPSPGGPTSGPGDPVPPLNPEDPTNRHWDWIDYMYRIFFGGK